MAADLIRYDLLVQDALRGVVRKVLSDVARDGIPGEHHFYIGFRTHARGVRLSARMRELYPDEMTIVLQHQFWDLSVSGEAFEVGLSFQNIPEMLLIPFDAVTRFADPSVGFELQFAVEDEAAGVSDGDGVACPGDPGLAGLGAGADGDQAGGLAGEDLGDAGELSGGGIVALEEEVVHLAVGEGVEQDGAGWEAISAGAAYLLVVLLDRAGERGVDDGADVGFVDAHTEGDGGDDDF